MPLVTQKVVAKVLDTIDYDEHLDNVRKVYKMKCDALLNAFHKYASSKVHFNAALLEACCMDDYAGRS